MAIVETPDEAIGLEIPHVIKYMGSKKKILSNVLEAVFSVHEKDTICDLFAGSSILSGALRNKSKVWSNDIQEYSSILSNLYLNNYPWSLYPNLISDIHELALKHVKKVKQLYPELEFSYEQEKIKSLVSFNALEARQQKLLNFDFKKISHHLFIKNYSGTYWSFDQCLWIDAIRFVAEKYKTTPFYYPIMASLMFAMSYNSQSTGHYAQYRDANEKSSMNDILIYRKKEIWPYFEKKLRAFESVFAESNSFPFKVTSLDFLDCLSKIPKHSVVYADPPYCFVHYSRFYHALETLVKYDYPKVEFKGRYRKERHQSPFCISTKVKGSFESMFQKIKEKNAQLVLSYSNTGMINLDELINVAEARFGKKYKISVKYIDYLHSTMGRKNDKSREVQESLIIAETAS